MLHNCVFALIHVLFHITTSKASLSSWDFISAEHSKVVPLLLSFCFNAGNCNSPVCVLSLFVPHHFFRFSFGSLLGKAVCDRNCDLHIHYVSRNIRKCTLWHMRTTKTKLSLHLHTPWLESSLSEWRNFTSLSIQNAHSRDSYTQMRKLIWIFAGGTCPNVRFLSLQLIFSLSVHAIRYITTR